MLIPFIIMLILTIITSLIAIRMDTFSDGLRSSVDMCLQILPLLLVAMLLAGMLQAVVPKEFITRLLGKETGLKGIVIGALIGIIMPGGPYVSFPLLAVLYKGGASIGAVSALLSSWGLLGLFRFINFELPILGPHFAFARYISSFVFPVIIGVITQLLFGTK